MNNVRRKRVLEKVAQAATHKNLKVIQGAVAKLKAQPKVVTNRLTLSSPRPLKPVGPFKPSTPSPISTLPPKKRTLQFLARGGTKAMTGGKASGGDVTIWRENVSPVKPRRLKRPSRGKETSQMTPGTAYYQPRDTQTMVVDPQGRKRYQTFWGGGSGNLKEGVRIKSPSKVRPPKIWGNPVSTTGREAYTPKEVAAAYKKDHGARAAERRIRPVTGKYRAPVKWYKGL